MTLILVLLLACGGEKSWDSPEDCEGISAGADADECWARFAPEVFRTDPDRGVKLVEERVSDQRVRDFIWLTVTREVDPSSYKYCERIQEPALAERCRVLVSRPHLHRELLRGEGGAGGPQGAGGGPPPGGGPPGGPAGPQAPGGPGPMGGPPPPGGGSPPPGGGSPPPPGGGAPPQ